MKKAISLLLSMVIILSMAAPIGTYAKSVYDPNIYFPSSEIDLASIAVVKEDDNEVSGYYINDQTYSKGSNIHYTFDKATNTLTLEGNGTMSKRTSNYCYLSDLNAGFYNNSYYMELYPEIIYQKTEKIIISSGITSIGYNAFYNFQNLKSLYIGKLSDINSYAFDECPKLKDIYLNGTITNWRDINIALGNDAVKKATLHYSKRTYAQSGDLSITADKKSFVYDGKIHKPVYTVKEKNNGYKLVQGRDYNISYVNYNSKGIGEYTVRLDFKGDYYGTVCMHYSILPKGTSISSLTSSKKGFTVKWKKQTTQTTGYQIQYSTSSNFKSTKTITVGKNTTVSKAVSKLQSKKKYYVRVRTYKVVKHSYDNVYYYSAWSKAKSITTK